MTAKFGLERAEFLHALEKVGKVIPSGSAAPILQNFWAEARADGTVFLSATDKSVTLSTVLKDSVVVAAVGRVLLPAKDVVDMVKRASGKLIVVMAHDEQKDTVVIGCGPTKWSLRTKSIDNYPVPESLFESQIHTVNRLELLNGINTVKKAVASNFKPSLTQIGVSGGKMVAADGVWFQECAVAGIADLDIAIPGPPIADIVALLTASSADTLDMGIAEQGSIVFHVGDDVLTTHTMTLPFPDVSKSFLQPALSNSFGLKVSRKALADSVRRIRITSDPEKAAVLLDLSLKNFEEAKVYSKNVNGSSSEESIEVEWSGGDRTIAFNHEYLLNFLEAFSFEDDEIEFLFGDDVKNKPSPALVKSGDRIGVLSQLRVDLL